LLPFALLLIAASSPPKHGFWSGGVGAAKARSYTAGSMASPGGSAAVVAALPEAAKLLDEMSDEEVLGQLFMMTYPGDSPPELLFDWIEKRGLGGVKIFGWNAEDTDKLGAAIAAIQSRALASGKGIPLLIATDQEGGWIRHIKGATTVTPGNMAIGASGRPYDAYWSAYYIGRELDALGVNMNFAPAVDLATRPRSSIIGPRAFSSDPEAAAALGAAYFRGLEAAGVIATAKHYPGHGDTDLDSHGVLPVINIDGDLLWKRELVPFRLIVNEGIPAIMSGHLNFPLIAHDGEPASLSKYFMTDLLRGKIGFAGVAVTDDLLMSGAANGANLADACYEAISAGDDLLMASRIIAMDDPAWARLLSAYKRDPAFRARAREAATRVIALKLAYLKPKGAAALVPDCSKLASRLPDREGQAFFAGQAFRAATSLGPNLPWKPRGRILLVAGASDFFKAAQALYPSAASFRYTPDATAAARAGELAAFDAAMPGVGSVLVCVQSEASMDYALRAKAAGKEVAIISLLSPEPLARAPRAMVAVAVYGNSRQCMEAGLAALHGDEAAQGSLPLTLAP
jgi:beta-N-acetylhexosaminidase